MTSEKTAARIYFPGSRKAPEGAIRFIRSHPLSTWFHLCPVTGCSPARQCFIPVLVVASADHRITGIIVAYHITDPAGNPAQPDGSRLQVNGGPLICGDRDEKGMILELLLRHLVDFASKRAAILEFRNSFSTGEELKTWLRLGFSFSDHLNLIKEITTKEQLWRGLGANRRRQIRKASSSGTTVRPAETDDQVKEFYSILSELYRNRVRKTLPPLGFYLDFFHICQSRGKGIILLAFRGESVIGGIVCPIMEKKMMHEWYICGLDKEYPHHHPSVMITWHALLYACDLGIRQFDFMGLGKPGVPYGVRDFKLRFGGEVVNFGRYTYTFPR